MHNAIKLPKRFLQYKSATQQNFYSNSTAGNTIIQ